MAFLAFILGLSLGIGFCFWKQHQINRQLRQTLKLLPHSAADEISLPMLSRLRREITHFNQHYQLLEEELQSWQKLLKIAPVGFLQVDEENQLLWCNDQAQEMLRIDRWQPGQLRLLLELVRSYELDQLIEQTRSSQQTQTHEWVFHTTIYPYGKTTDVARSRSAQSTHSLPLKASSCPLSDGQVGVFLENQQPLVALTQSRDRAFSDLTHELRTPLTSIHLVAEALQSRLKPPEQNWATQLLQETNRLMQLVQDCLEISQLEKDPSIYLHFESVDLEQLIFQAWQTLEPLAKQKGLHLSYSGSDRIYLVADKSRLTQVFLNLFDNSIKHSPAQAEILVEVETLTRPEKDGFIQINIIDWGSGFSPADLPYVFDRLYRGDLSRQRQQTDSEKVETVPLRRGSGLGLSIVKQIILAHGGYIQAQNHPETGGAWLKIELPKSMRS